MKEGWEIKTLGDVCDVLNGLWTGKKEPFVNICVIRNTNFTKDCKLNLDNVAYIDAEVKQFTTRKLKVGDIIVEKSGGSEKQPVGRVVLFDVESGDYSFSNFTSALRVKSGIDLNPNYLHKCLYAHYLRGETFKLQSKTTGLHNLDMKGYLKLPIPVPSSPEQEKIVAELDCLSGIIEKKKQQLKEYDALAQSIFYEMFGDPVENEKGWEIKSLKDVCTKITDGTHNSPKSYATGTYMYITAKNIKKDGFDMCNITYVLEDVHRSIYSRCNPVFGDILYIKDGATTGIAMINTLNEEFSLLSSVALLKCDKSIISNVYLRDVLNFSTLYKEIRENMGGAAITRLTLKKIESINIPLPPLSLQQEFASKIEAIEKQKALIKKSIEEVETLFNSRMDYYFN